MGKGEKENSLHLQHKAFQIFPFGVVDADRVVNWLVELVYNAHISVRIGRRAKDYFAEQISGNILRTRKCKDKAAWFYPPESLQIYLLVATRGINYSPGVFRKSGWVQDNNIVIVFLHFFQVFKAVRCEAFMVCIGEVQLYIIIPRCYCVFGYVYRMHHMSAARQRVYAETAGIAECIEHLFTI